jgi:hypothetical protein
VGQGDSDLPASAQPVLSSKPQSPSVLLGMWVESDSASCPGGLSERHWDSPALWVTLHVRHLCKASVSPSGKWTAEPDDHQGLAPVGDGGWGRQHQSKVTQCPCGEVQPHFLYGVTVAFPLQCQLPQSMWKGSTRHASMRLGETFPLPRAPDSWGGTLQAPPPGPQGTF